MNPPRRLGAGAGAGAGAEAGERAAVDAVPGSGDAGRVTVGIAEGATVSSARAPEGPAASALPPSGMSIVTGRSALPSSGARRDMAGRSPFSPTSADSMGGAGGASAPSVSGADASREGRAVPGAAGSGRRCGAASSGRSVMARRSLEVSGGRPASGAVENPCRRHAVGSGAVAPTLDGRVGLLNPRRGPRVPHPAGDGWREQSLPHQACPRPRIAGAPRSRPQPMRPRPQD